jgi:hypothetical protein
MENQDTRKWYQKKRFIIPIAILGIVGIANTGGKSDSQKTTLQPAPQVQGVTKQVLPQTIQTVRPQIQQPITPQSDSGLSNDNHYINTYGNDVHSPAYSNNGSVPAGASAQCGDGTYSFSQSRRGTCSHHGGVAVWY